MHFPTSGTEVLTICEVAVYGEIIKQGESFKNLKESTNSINLSENCLEINLLKTSIYLDKTTCDYIFWNFFLF